VDFDTLIVPDAPHSAGLSPYGMMRTMKYFMNNLGGPLPAAN
jgi:hypothetical protein